MLNVFVKKKKRFSVKKYSVKKHFINLTKHQNLVPIISKSESFDVEKSLCTRAAIFEPSGGITLKKRLDSVMEMTPSEITGSVMQRSSHVNMIQNFPRSLKMDRGKVENRSGLRRIET